MISSVQSDDSHRRASQAGTRIGTVYISNLSEDVWPFITSMKDAAKRTQEIQENALLSDRDVLNFLDTPNVLVILPQPCQPEFWPYIQSILKKPLLPPLSPNLHSGEICLDILQDHKLLEKIKTFAKKFNKLHLLSYSSSPQFYKLVEFLQSQGLNVETPEAPAIEDAWTVNFFGSKTGIRHLIPEHMAPGKITTGRHNAAALAAKFFQRDGGVVLKIHKGHAGAGVLIVGPKDAPQDYPGVHQAILNQLIEDEFWDVGPIVVEQYIALDESIGGGSPSVEFVVLPDGKSRFLFPGGMRVTPAGMFKGMELNNTVFEAEIEKKMIAIGRKIARAYSREGYRGYFDVDFVVNTAGNPIVTESNVRRTGGTHLYHLGRALFGPNFLKKTHILSNNLYALPHGRIKTFSQLHAALQSLLFDKKTKHGLVIASATVLKMQHFGYVIFGHDKQDALQIEEKMEQLLSSA